MPRITVLAKPGAREESVEVREDGVVVVRVTARAVDGKANEAIRKVLARWKGCRSRDIVILTGLTSRIKHVEIPS